MSQSLNLARNNLLGPRIDPSIEAGLTGRGGLIASALLHAAIIVATLVTFSQAKLDIEDQSPPVVPVDLVSIAQKTNIEATVREPPKQIQLQVQPPNQDELQTRVPVIPEQAEVAPPPPDREASRPVPQKPRPVPLPKTKPQPTPEPKKKKQSEEDFSALLNKLTTPSAAPKNARVASRTQRGFGAQNAMTADLEDALRSQVQRCWDTATVIPPRREEGIVDFDLFLNPDGSVAQAPQLTGSSASDVASDPYTRAAADAARRAIIECQPYKLPPDRYADWREIDPFHFVPPE
jgi:outer membrane biosynthesis protein TonB